MEIKYESYAKVINIEARSMIDIASKQIIPAVMKYTRSLADTVNTVTAAGADASVQLDLLKETSGLLAQTKAALSHLIQVTEEAGKLEDRTGPGRILPR